MSDVPNPDGPAPGRPQSRPARLLRLLTRRASATQRALLLTALGALLIAGLVTALPIADVGPSRLASHINPMPGNGVKGSDAFAHAVSGDCLMWPERTPEAAAVVNCNDDHRFEVAESIDMRTFPGSEYGPGAAPPSPARIEQISQEQCEPAVRRYLGAKFDPDSKFVISMLWSGDKAWRQAGERRVLCGLQLPGVGNQQTAFTGKVADLDQSRVWPDGTCLGIDTSANQPTDIPVDCAAPHAMEVTGTVNLAEKFPDALPPEPQQDAFIKDTCTRLTDAYLAPVQLRSTTLTLIYNTLTLPSWSAGSREVACSIGATLGNGGWATLLNSAKGRLRINGQPPVPPPDIPPERLNLPPILPPASPPPANPPQAPSAPSPSSPAGQRQGNEHLPQQPAAPAPQQPAAPAQGPAAPAPPPAAPLPPADTPPPDAPAPDLPAPGE